MYIYHIENIVNGKGYVGMTTRCVNLRFSEHIRQARTDKCRIGLHGAIKKYGADCFKVSVICEASSLQELIQLEIDYISKLSTMSPHGYNLKSGGIDGFYAGYVRKSMSDKRKGQKHTNESKLKMSLSQKGRPRTRAQIESIKIRNIGNKYALGYKQTDEHKDRISRGNKGKVRTLAVKKILSELNSGNNHPQSDQTVYLFKHRSGECFTGTRSDFLENKGFRLSHLFGKNKRKMYKGWSLNES